MYKPITEAESRQLLDTTERPEVAMGAVGGPSQGYGNAFEHNKRLQNNLTAIQSMRKVLSSPAVYVGADAWLALMQSPTWRIKPGDDSPQSQKHVDHLGANLGIGQPPALAVPWAVRLESLLSSVLYGFGVWELVCRKVEGVWYTDMQSRDQASLSTFITGPNDELVAIEQTALSGWTRRVAQIPASRLLHIVHRPRGDNDFHGMGTLRACEPEYGDRVKLSGLAISGAQRWALPTPVCKPNQEMARQMGITPEQMKVEISDAEAMLSKYTSSEQAYLILPPWIEIVTFGGDVTAPQAIDAMIDARDRRMLTVFLQQHLMLGSANAGGTYSMAETHVKAAQEHAAQTLTRLCRQLSSFIQRCIQWQFGDVPRATLPTIEFDGLNSETFVQNLAALASLVTVGLLTPDDGLEDELRRALEFQTERTSVRAPITPLPADGQ